MVVTSLHIISVIEHCSFLERVRRAETSDGYRVESASGAMLQNLVKKFLEFTIAL